MKHRPCGACTALVPADTGCEHWTPGMSVKTLVAKQRRAQEKARYERQRAARRSEET